MRRACIGIRTSHHKYIVDTVGEAGVILLILDADDSDEPIASFVHAKGQVIMQYDGPMPDTNAERYFYLHDRLGSVRQVIDKDANIKNCYTYDPWGLTTGDEMGRW